MSLFAFAGGLGGGLGAAPINPFGQMPGGGGMDANGTGTQTQGSSKQRLSIADPNRKKQLTLPATLKMILKAGKPKEGVEGVVIHGQSCPKVGIVGQVMSINRGLNFFELVLDDTTAVIDCTIYTSEEGTLLQETLSNIQSGDYIEIIGSVRLREGKLPMVTGYVVNKVKNSNNIPQHLLESIRCGIELLKTKPLEQLTPFNASTANENNTAVAADGAAAVVKGEVTMMDAPTAGGGGAGVEAPVVKEDLDTFLKKRLSEIPQGRSKEETVEMCVKSGYAQDDVGKLFDEWMIEGLIYESIPGKYAFLEGI